MKILITIALVLLSVFYPLVVYFGLQHASPALFSVLFLMMAVLRFATARNRTDIAQIAPLLVVSAYSLGILIFNSEQWLKLYPVIMSGCVAALFALSLFQPKSLIERIARLRGENITPRAKHYTKRLTLMWALLLTVNGLVALYLAEFASFSAWALYCGLISYGILGSFFVIELFFRRYYINKYGP